MLQLGSDYDITSSVRTNELGLDSLIAVNIRSWFAKNYQVNIPALKILRGASVGELAVQVLDAIPEKLIPNVAGIDIPGAGAKAEIKEPAVLQSLSSTRSSASTTDPTDTPTTAASDASTGDKEVTGRAKEPSPLTSLKNEIDQEPRLAPVAFQKSGPLSHSQSMFWFVHQLLDEKQTLNSTAIYHLRGELRIPDLARAVRAVGQRHEALRTCFWETDGQQPIQRILESSQLILEHKNIHTQLDLTKEYEALKDYVYDLLGGRAMRLVLLSYSVRDHYLLIGYHHLIFDGVSHGTFLGDIQRAYNGEQLSSTNLLQYLQHSNQQRDQYLAGDWHKQIAFWRQTLATIPEPLPVHRSLLSERQPLTRYAPRVAEEFHIDHQLAAQVRKVARSYGATPFHFYLAAFRALLYRFLGVEDLCIGIVDGSRRDEEMQDSIGPYLNVLPVRLSAREDQLFSQAIEDAREESVSALSNSLPLEVILNELQLSRSPTHTPIFQTFVNYLEGGIEEGQKLCDCLIEMKKHDPARLAYDITATIVVTAVTGEANIYVAAQEALYSEGDGLLLAQGYEDILREFTKAPTQQIGNVFNFRKVDLQRALSIGRGMLTSFILAYCYNLQC